MDLQLIGLAVTGDDYAKMEDVAEANGGVDPRLAAAQMLMAWVAGTIGREAPSNALGSTAGLGGFAEGISHQTSLDTLAGEIVVWTGVVYEQTTRKDIARLMTADARAARGMLVTELADAGVADAILIPELVKDGLVRVARGGRTTLERLVPIWNVGPSRIPYGAYLALIGYNYVAGLLTGMQVAVWSDN